MSPSRDHPWHYKGRHRLLPPLATALVFVIFATLFCVFALMDLRRLETLLLMVLQNRGLATVQALEKAAQENHRRLLQGYDIARFPNNLAYAGSDEDLALRESLINSLLDLARAVSLQAQEKELTAPELAGIAQAEHLSGILLIDANGQIICQTGSGLAEQARIVAPLLRGQDEVTFRLFDPPQQNQPWYYLGLRRQEGTGVVVLVLDQAGLEFWQWRTAVQEALRGFSWSPDLAYFILTTPEDRLLVQAGQVPERHLGLCQLLSSRTDGREQSANFCTMAGGERVLELTVPFLSAHGRLETARIGLLTQETDALLRDSRRHIFLWTGILIGVGLVAMVFIYLFQNRYLTRLQTMRERLQQAERLSSLGRLAAGVAHEIRNPLNTIGIAVQRLRREFFPKGEDRQQVFANLTKIVQEEIGRLNAIVEEFLSLSRGGRLDLQPVSLATLFEKTQALFQSEAQTRGVQILVQGADACPTVTVDSQKMQQVLINLMKNALEALSGPGEIRLAARSAGPDHVQLTISDTGPGLTAAEITQIFDPYYTTKKRGLGLGLAIAHEIVQAHGGQMTVQSTPGKGTTFTILLPRQG